MSAAFRDFLQQQAQLHRAELLAGKATVAEWRSALERLFQQLRGWLKESDPDNLIDIEERQHEIIEPGLGRYAVSRLDLHVLGKWIGIVPKARRTVATAKPSPKSPPNEPPGASI